MNEKAKYILYLITGIIGLIISFFIYISKRKDKIIITKLSCDLIWSLNFFFKGALGYAGAIQNFIGLIRECIFYGKSKKIKFLQSKIWLFIFCLAFCSIPLLTWKEVGWYSLLPSIASVMLTISLFVDNVKLSKIVVIPACLLCILYTVLIFNLFSLIANILILIGAIIGLIREYKSK